MTLPRFRRPTLWLVGLPVGALLAQSAAGGGGVLELWRLHQERHRTYEEIFTLCRDNDGLRQKILDLRRSDRKLERLAREELGLVRDGEIVYRFPREESDGLARSERQSSSATSASY